MAGIFRKIFGSFLHKKEEKDEQVQEKRTPVVPPEQRTGSGGYSRRVTVPADPIVYAPVVTQCNGNGGVQVSCYFSKCPTSRSLNRFML